MIGGLVATFAGSAWARAALRYGVTALAILLFLLALRRSGERAGRLAALAVATSLLSGCATVGSEGGEFGACPPVVEYSRKFQARAAEVYVETVY